jgi:hypothetical protein
MGAPCPATGPRWTPGLLSYVVRVPGCGLAEVALADNVVAVEDGAGLVARHGHGDPLSHPRPDEVTHDRTPEVVKQLSRYACGLAGVRPGLFATPQSASPSRGRQTDSRGRDRATGARSLGREAVTGSTPARHGSWIARAGGGLPQPGGRRPAIPGGRFRRVANRSDTRSPTRPDNPQGDGSGSRGSRRAP